MPTDQDLAMAIATVIAQRIAASGRSRREVMRSAGVSRQALYRVGGTLREPHLPSLRLLYAVCRELGVSVPVVIEDAERLASSGDL